MRSSFLLLSVTQHSTGFQQLKPFLLMHEQGRESCQTIAKKISKARKVANKLRAVKDKVRNAAAGKATIVGAGDALRLRHVPKDTWYGPVSTEFPAREDGSLRCFGPGWRIIGHGVPNSAEGVSRTTLRYMTYHRNPGGTATVFDGDGSCPVGGFVVIPKWMR